MPPKLKGSLFDAVERLITEDLDGWRDRPNAALTPRDTTVLALGGLIKGLRNVGGISGMDLITLERFDARLSANAVSGIFPVDIYGKGAALHRDYDEERQRQKTLLDSTDFKCEARNILRRVRDEEKAADLIFHHALAEITGVVLGIARVINIGDDIEGFKKDLHAIVDQAAESARRVTEAYQKHIEGGDFDA